MKLLSELFNCWEEIPNNVYQSMDDGVSIATIVNNNIEHFEELGGIGGIGIMVAQDEKYNYIVHYYYDDTAKSEFTHMADIFRSEKVVSNNEYPDQVDPADEDHIYFNADPGEKPK